MQIRHLLGASALALVGAAAQASTVSWDQWSGNDQGSFSNAAGASIGVTFSGQELLGSQTGYPSWQPASTWADGSIVANAPTSADGVRMISENGDQELQTIKFSQAVTNPVMAIWSLGSEAQSEIDFQNGLVPVEIAGGPNAENGGFKLIMNGSQVIGSEGNGTIQFIGTFTSISWISPTNILGGDTYGFTFGDPLAAATVPEPASLALAALALVGAGLSVRRAGGRSSRKARPGSAAG